MGDARDLPFADRSFDVAVALDLLEHIPPGDRPAALAELGRVTARRLIVGCPTAARPAARTGGCVPASRRGSAAPEWLREHIELGLPESADLQRGLAPFGSVRLHSNENASTHLGIALVHYLLGWSWPVRALVGALLGGCRREARWVRLVTWVLRGGDRPPAYRTIAVVDVHD